MNTILIFTTRQLCYSSAEFFAARLAESFEYLGYDVETCQIDTDTNAGKGKDDLLTMEQQIKLEQYIGKSYLAVIDINSRLPRMILDDGSHYLDHIDAPFYDYILDNPLYQHESLSQQLHNFNVIMVDQNHCSYVKEYYPHIRSVMWQTLGAAGAVSPKQLDQKRQEILFIGTSQDPNIYLEQIRSDKNSEQMLELADMMLQDPSLTMQRALENVLLNHGEVVTKAEFALRMNQTFRVELYLRNYYRKAAVDALASAHMPMRIIGEWWDCGKDCDYSSVTFEAPVTFARSYDKISADSILLDSSMFFKGGVHDRVFAGLANQAAVLTDRNPVKTQMLGDCISMYDPADPVDIVDHAEELLINHSYWKQCVDKAYEQYLSNYTWKHVAGNIAAHIQKQQNNKIS